MAHDDTKMEDASTTHPSISPTPLLSGETYSYYSPIPPSLETYSSPIVLGVDEAGRGPVLGPMVYGVFYLPSDDSTPLLRTTHHFDDSKVLTPAVRSDLMTKICTPGTDLYETCGFAITAISARAIAAGMLGPGTGYNLNAQAMDTTITLIRGVIERGVNVQEVYVDTIGSPVVYQKKLEREFPGLAITVAKKADSLYPCVSAASVCAKVTRDVALEVMYEEFKKGRRKAANAEKEKDGDEEMEEGDDDERDEEGWGSGYPSDGRCVTWLKKNMHPIFGWGPECRLSWGTAKDMLELKGGVKVDWPVEEDENTMKVTDFFLAKQEDDVDELGTWFGKPSGQECF